MTKIYKYPLEVTDEQKVVMPAGAKIRTVMMQNGDPCLWAEVDTEAKPSERFIAIFGTGNPVPAERLIAYVGSFQMHGGRFVGHVYEVRPESWKGK